MGAMRRGGGGGGDQRREWACSITVMPCINYIGIACATDETGHCDARMQNVVPTRIVRHASAETRGEELPTIRRRGAPSRLSFHLACYQWWLHVALLL